MSRRIVWSLLTLLVMLRLPSLVQPAGADQDLYSYVGQEIARGGLPYRDAWDQKPPAIHYTYALLFSIWPRESVVAAADLATAAAVALLLVAFERRVTGSPGFACAAIFLLLGNPAYSRLGGMWLRGQCETFIALAVTAALLLLNTAARASAEVPQARRWALRLAAGLLLGVAISFKYNAAAYGLVAIVAVIAWRHRSRRDQPEWAQEAARDAAGLAAGAIMPLAAIAAIFMASGAWGDLWDATITYNLRYSGETYHGLADVMWYAVTFPVRQARVDGLWLLGGAGCLLLLTRIRRDPGALIVVAWVASACLAIVVNGSRGLPQYFVQANPALAMAAGLGALTVYRAVRARTLLTAAAVLAVLALSRVVPARKAVESTLADARYMAGALSQDDYLERFGGQRPTDKHVPIAVTRLAQYLRQHSSPSDTVYVFGFSQGALVQSRRRSASRFFWSRPIIVGFNEGRPGYGAAGLLADLTAAKPAVVALQVNDWQMEGTDSARYFTAHEALSSWLENGYTRQPDQDNFRIWRRRPS